MTTQQPDGQCWFQCKHKGPPSRRCKGKAGPGKLSCFRKTHECSVANEVYENTEMPKELSEIIGGFLLPVPITAYLIGGISGRTGRNKPFFVDSVTNIDGVLHFPIKKTSLTAGEFTRTQWGGGSFFGSCALDGKIYVFGGRNNEDSDEMARRKVAVYSPVTDTWDTTTIPMMPGGLLSSTAVTVGSTIYVLGCEDNSRNARPEPMYMLDTVSFQWSTVDVTMPPVHHPTVCNIDHVIYAFGGRDIDDVYDDHVYTFDTEATEPRWEILVARIPGTSPLSKAIVFKKKIYLFGDEDTFHVFDPEDETFRQLSPPGEDFDVKPFLLDDEKYIHVVTREKEKIRTYDVDKDTWLTTEVLIPNDDNEERYHFSVVSVEG